MSYSYTADREAFISKAGALGLPVSRARIVLAAANTIQRIAADECSDEYRYTLIEAKRLRCPECERTGPTDRPYDLSRPRLCPEHVATARIAAALKGMAPIAGVEYSGDPRGCCVKLKVPSGKGDSWGGDDLLCVPTREY